MENLNEQFESLCDVAKTCLTSTNGQTIPSTLFYCTASLIGAANAIYQDWKETTRIRMAKRDAKIDRGDSRIKRLADSATKSVSPIGSRLWVHPSPKASPGSREEVPESPKEGSGGWSKGINTTIA